MNQTRRAGHEQGLRLSRSTFARASMALLLLAAAPLAVTGFAGWWLWTRLEGWWLLAHMAAAPLMLLGLAGWALFGPQPAANAGAGAASRWARAASHRLAVGLGFLAGASMLAAMSDFFGYAAQEKLLDLHRYASLGFCVALAAHASLAVSRSVRR